VPEGWYLAVWKDDPGWLRWIIFRETHHKVEDAPSKWTLGGTKVYVPFKRLSIEGCSTDKVKRIT
jgi:hypothetical protein